MSTTFIPYIPEKSTITFEWMTAVDRASDSKERRSGLWAHPKVTFKLSYSLIGDDPADVTGANARRALRSTLVNNNEDRFSIPLRHESILLENDVASGDAILIVRRDQSQDWAAIGRDVYVEVDENEDGYLTSIVDVTVVGDNLELELADVAPADLSATTTRISPVVTIQPLDGTTLGRYRVEAGTLELSGTLQTFYMTTQGYGITIPTNIEGFNVWTQGAIQDAASQIGERFLTGQRLLGEPLTESITLWPKSLVQRDLLFAIDGIDEWRTWKAQLWACWGQQIPFLRPTFRDDLVLAVQPGSPTNELVVSDTPDYRDWYAGAYTFRRLALEMSDGSIDTVRVTNVTDNLDGTLTLTLSAAYSRGTDTIDRISFLESTRLAADAVVLSTAKGLMSSLSLQTLTGDWLEVT